MAEIIEITDLNSPEINIFSKLTETQLRNKLEPEKGIFIAESYKVIEVALKEGYTPLAFLMSKKRAFGSCAELIERAGVKTYVANDELLSSLIGYSLTRGILCAFRRPEVSAAETVLSVAKRVAVLENITDATNLGAIVRSAAALNIDALLLTPSCCDPYNRRAVRVSMGTIFQIPWARIGEEITDWPCNGLKKLNSLGFKTAAMALTDNSVSVSDERLKREEKLAIVLGTEGDGLSEKTIASCDYTVKIPMSHGVDSLNVAAASAVAFWELRYRK